VRPWIDYLGFSIVKAVGVKNPRLFYFLDKESLNVFNTIYIKFPRQHPAFQRVPMDNAGASGGAVSWMFILLLGCNSNKRRFIHGQNYRRNQC
jgi:hypothetical protein